MIFAGRADGNRERPLSVPEILLAVICLCGLPPAARAVGTDGLLAEWTFDQGAETVAHDSGGQGRDATVSGAGRVQEGERFSLSLDGVDDYVEFAGSPGLNLTGPVTVEAWIKPLREGEGRLACLLGQDLHSYLLGFEGADECHWYIGAGANHVRAYLKLHQWNHVAATFDGARMALWLNGRLASERESQFGSYDKRDGFLMGTKGRPDLPKFKGLLDTVRVYNRALSEEEIVAHATEEAAAHGVRVPPRHAAVVHYRFDEDTGDVAQDMSGYRNDGRLVQTEYLEEFDGRSGVMRFDGKESLLTIPKSDSARFEGDLTFEMWVRRNGPVTNRSGMLFGDRGAMRLSYSDYVSLVLWYGTHSAELDAHEGMLVPVDRNIFSDRWSHIAVVVEYPRCKFYHNAKLIRDAYMPLPGIVESRADRVIGKQISMDMDEFRYYRRALTAAEIAAHAAGKELHPPSEMELSVESHWYENTITLRLNARGVDLTNHDAEMLLLGDDDERASAPLRAALTQTAGRSGRYVASATFPLDKWAGRSVTAAARVLRADGQPVRTVRRQVSLEKPDWVHTPEGYSDKVLPPWTPLEARHDPDGAVEIHVWGRRYRFGSMPFPRHIGTDGREILFSPIVLTGRVDGQDMDWVNTCGELATHSEKRAALEHRCESDALTLSVDTQIEYDGYMIFECELTARLDVVVEALRLDIPLRSEFAVLCYADAVFPSTTAESGLTNYTIMDHSGTVRGDQAFRFTSVAWLGDGTRGLCWQAESDECWHNADEQKAIEVLPRENTTTFRVRLVDVRTPLEQGASLRYKFALQATPIKAKLRDAWDLRMVRFEPYGRELSLPDMTTEGRPALDVMAESGVRCGAYMVCDLWSYPMPVHETFSGLLRRFNEEVHARGMQAIGYQMHPRFPTAAPEFDIHGLHMVNRPLRPYSVGGAPSGTPRPGPINIDYGANSQAPVSDCPKSMALQDACVHSFARRMDTFGDDGVYLDGRIGAPACKNLLHGCGYRAEDGSIRATRPVFAAREFMRRIYTVVKTRKPDGVVDAHSSFEFNLPALAYADVLWSGEQWWHLKKTSGPEDGYVSGIFPLDMCRVEFTGSQIGIAGNHLVCRSGPGSKVSAITLLHDVPYRPSSSGSKAWPTSLFPKLWKMREAFGAKEAEKLFYWENADYVQVQPDKCYATLFKHPGNGTLAFVSNLRRTGQMVSVNFNLDNLGLSGKKLEVINALTEEAVVMTPGGELSVPLESEDWIYVWLRPAVGG